jgi:2-polyprenyl-3-methyl-5-hydroxy-6-metoxy-1,4-benzoquinol methylase
VSSCCRPGDFDKIFDEKHARSKARAYARDGLTGDTRRIADLVRGKMSPDYTVLEVGGGIGEIGLELLRDGAARVMNVELATKYESVAAELIRERGVGDRVERRLGDFVSEADGVPAADVVVMHRVVCCYPDADALVGAAAVHARRLLVLTIPVDRWWLRWGIRMGNAVLALRRNSFRGYVHATRVVVAAAERRGMRLAERRRGLIWQLIALERSA